MALDTAVRIDDVSTTLTYIGLASVKMADSSPNWQIRKMETTGTVMKITWADGNSLFDNVWSDRASLSYS